MCFPRKSGASAAAVAANEEANNIAAQNAFEAKRQADEARATEEARQGRIRAGMDAIDQQFAGFDEPFYDARRQAYLNFAMPQFGEQETAARRELAFALDRAGLTNSSAAADKQKELELSVGRQRQAIAGQADDLVTQARGDVANARTQLVNTLNATADPANAMTLASTRRAELATTPSFSPIGQLFASIAQGIGNASTGFQSQNAYNTAARDYGVTIRDGAGTASSRTVR